MDKKLFSQEQIDYLISDNTLLENCGRSILERCMDFRRKFPGGYITPYKLRKLYRGQKIRKKYRRFTKLPDEPKQIEIAEKAAVLGREIRFALSDGFRLVYLDEMR